MMAGDARYLQRARDIRRLLNGEWIIPILVALSAGPLHYKELFAAIEDMDSFDPWAGSQRVIRAKSLIRTVRRLQAAGLVLRHEERSFPRSVIYSLTDAAVDLLNSVRPAVDWAEQNLDLIARLHKANSEDGGTDGGEDDDLGS